MIKIDDIDLKIIYYLYFLKKDESISTYKLGEKIFGYGKNIKEKRKTANFIRYRLKQLSKYNLIDIGKNENDFTQRTYYYDLIANNIKIKSFKYNKLNISGFLIFLKINDEWLKKPYFLVV